MTRNVFYPHPNLPPLRGKGLRISRNLDFSTATAAETGHSARAALRNDDGRRLLAAVFLDFLDRAFDTFFRGFFVVLDRFGKAVASISNVTGIAPIGVSIWASPMNDASAARIRRTVAH